MNGLKLIQFYEGCLCFLDVNSGHSHGQAGLFGLC
jgi:hypothetical protein